MHFHCFRWSIFHDFVTPINSRRYLLVRSWPKGCRFGGVNFAGFRMTGSSISLSKCRWWWLFLFGNEGRNRMYKLVVFFFVVCKHLVFFRSCERNVSSLSPIELSLSMEWKKNFSLYNIYIYEYLFEILICFRYRLF